VYFANRTSPFWEMTDEQMQGTLQNLGTLWWRLYLFPPVYVLAPLLLLLGLVLWRRTDTDLRAMALLVVLGCGVYSALWFLRYRDDEYYVIEELMAVALMALVGVQALGRHWPALHSSPWVALVIGVFLAFGVRHLVFAKHYRNAVWAHELPSPTLYAPEFHTALQDWGLPDTAKVLALPDYSPNLYLSALQRRGWSAFDYPIQYTQQPLAQWLETHPAQAIVLTQPDLLALPHVWADFPPADTLRFQDVVVLRLR
jgi:hypothetical protein